jgi:Flp pilus assembly pilin Flp
MYKINHKRGQSTVEYILLVTAVIAVMIVFATSKDKGLQGKLSNTLNETSTQITNMSDRLDNSYAQSDEGSPDAPITFNVMSKDDPTEGLNIKD